MDAATARQLDSAEKLYAKGKITRAARLVGAARKYKTGDAADEVQDVIDQMRRQLDRERLMAFDKALAEEIGSFAGSTAPTAEEADLTALGFWMAIAGAAAMVIAVFLPEASATTFAQIEHNTLIQNGDGWIFVGLALGDLGAIFAAYQARRRTWAPLVTGALAVAAAVYAGESSNVLKLCSVTDPTVCQRASAGTGIYLAGLGGVLMLIGGWRLRKARPVVAVAAAPSATTPGAVDEAPLTATVVARPTKRCPDCAEDVLADARKCRYCSHVFEVAPAPRSG